MSHESPLSLWRRGVRERAGDPRVRKYGSGASRLLPVFSSVLIHAGVLGWLGLLSGPGSPADAPPQTAFTEGQASVEVWLLPPAEWLNSGDGEDAREKKQPDAAEYPGQIRVPDAAGAKSMRSDDDGFPGREEQDPGAARHESESVRRLGERVAEVLRTDVLPRLSEYLVRMAELPAGPVRADVAEARPPKMLNAGADGEFAATQPAGGPLRPPGQGPEETQKPDASAGASKPRPHKAEDESKPDRPGVQRRALVREMPAPKYPRMCRRRGHEGLVLLEVEVLSSGKTGRISVLRHAECVRLAEAATEAVRKASFVPSRRGGRAVDSVVIIPFRFELR